MPCGGMTVTERPSDIIGRPMIETGRGDVGDVAYAFGIGAAGEPRLVPDCAEPITRRVTLRTMAERLDKIVSSVPCDALRRIVLDRRTVEIKSFPQTDTAADIER